MYEIILHKMTTIRSSDKIDIFKGNTYMSISCDDIGLMIEWYQIKSYVTRHVLCALNFS